MSNYYKKISILSGIFCLITMLIGATLNVSRWEIVILGVAWGFLSGWLGFTILILSTRSLKGDQKQGKVRGFTGAMVRFGIYLMFLLIGAYYQLSIFGMLMGLMDIRLAIVFDSLARKKG